MMKRLKAMAMYLPQFHRIPENDEWWGDGYTDWVAVKTAGALFEGHNQPRIPLGNNYYDLSDTNVIRRQAEMARRFGIDGFCIYHYYFKDGKKVLEKPAEALLRSTDIDIDYCFCWANETWARSWKKMHHVNAWAEKFEGNVTSDNDILLQQDYGTREDWKKHFEYLLPFFKDSRYLKKDNKPVFVVYLPDDIPMFNEMISLFDRLCKDAGFSGIYTIGSNVFNVIPGMDAAMFIHIRNDVLGMPSDYVIHNGVRTRNYEDVWKRMLSLPCVDRIQTYFGGFVDRDDTPRKGARGYCLLESSPEKFEESIYKLAIKNIHYGNEFLFIDAWNEWGEGCYLEPDVKNGYGYLEAVNRVISRVNEDSFDSVEAWKRIRLEANTSVYNNEFQRSIRKYQLYYKVLDQWFRINEQGKTVGDFFVRNGINTILIYGYTSLADHLINALNGTDVNVMGYIDRRYGYQTDGIPVFNIEKGFPRCDAIIVTPIYDFDVIFDSLIRKTDSRIISIEEVIFGVEVD